jgi:hypothetical protein
MLARVSLETSEVFLRQTARWLFSDPGVVLVFSTDSIIGDSWKFHIALGSELRAYKRANHKIGL